MNQIENGPLEYDDIDDLLHVTSDDDEVQGQRDDILSDVNDFFVEEMIDWLIDWGVVNNLLAEPGFELTTPGLTARVATD